MWIVTEREQTGAKSVLALEVTQGTEVCCYDNVKKLNPNGPRSGSVLGNAAFDRSFEPPAWENNFPHTAVTPPD
jgi:hypothetical protein